MNDRPIQPIHPVKILFLAAEPSNTPELGVPREFRDIQERLQRSPHRDRFKIEIHLATRSQDIISAILNLKPQIVHFSGHGASSGELCFEDDLGNKQLVTPHALSALFELASGFVKCVVLNACYSEIQAQAIVEHIDYVIGMNTRISDRGAIAFSVGFYTALGANRASQEAFNAGLVQIQLSNIPEQLTPVLLEKKIDFYYVERPRLEKLCYEEIVRSGALIRITAPNSMGKTLLMNRIVTYAKANNYQTVTLSCSEIIDSNPSINMENFVKSFCRLVSQKLKLDDKFDDKFDEYTDPYSVATEKAKDYFQNYLLVSIPNSLVLALDDVDRVFQQNVIAENFCSLIRNWFNFARQGDASSRIWAKLRLIIVHSTENYPHLNINTSPLANLGFPISLREFYFAETQNLINRYCLDWTEEEINNLLEYLGGNPTLLNKAFQVCKLNNWTCEYIIEIGSTLNSPFIAHLTRLQDNLNRNQNLVRLFRRVINSENPIQITANTFNDFKDLQRLGLVKIEGNSARPFCPLYREYFRFHLQ